MATHHSIQCPPAMLTEGSPRKVEWLLLGLLACLAVALRLVRIGQESFWIDEVWSESAVREGVFQWIWNVESTPPFFFLLLKAWSFVFGTSHEAQRAFSSLLGGLAVPALYLCARRWQCGRAAALAAAGVLLIHPMAYWHSQQNRYYMTMMLLGILWLTTIPALLHPPRRHGMRWGFVLCGFLSFATHYYFLFYAAGVGVGVLAWWAWSSRARRVWVGILLNFGAMGACMALLLPLLLHQQQHAPDSFLQPPTTDELLDVFRRFYWVGLWVWEGHWHAPFAQWRVRVILLLVALALGGYAWRAARMLAGKSSAREAALLRAGLVFFCAFVLPILASFAYSRWRTPIFIPGRYPILFLPAFVLWLTTGWALGPRRLRLGMLAAGVIGFTGLGFASIAGYWANFQDFDWRGAAARVDAEWREGDAMLFCPDWNRASFVNNGGTPRNVLPAHDLAGAERATRVWMFIWEQAPEDSGRVALQALRARRPVQMLIDLPQMTLTRIQNIETSATLGVAPSALP